MDSRLNILPVVPVRLGSAQPVSLSGLGVGGPPADARGGYHLHVTAG